MGGGIERNQTQRDGPMCRRGNIHNSKLGGAVVPLAVTGVLFIISHSRRTSKPETDRERERERARPAACLADIHH